MQILYQRGYDWLHRLDYQFKFMLFSLFSAFAGIWMTSSTFAQRSVHEQMWPCRSGRHQMRRHEQRKPPFVWLFFLRGLSGWKVAMEGSLCVTVKRSVRCLPAALRSGFTAVGVSDRFKSRAERSDEAFKATAQSHKVRGTTSISGGGGKKEISGKALYQRE